MPHFHITSIISRSGDLKGEILERRKFLFHPLHIQIGGREGTVGGAACLEKWVLERAVLDMINAVLPTSVIAFFAYLYSGIKQDAKKYF